VTTTELLGELARPLLDPGQRAFAPFLLGAVLVAAAVHRRTGGRLRDLPGYLLPARLWRHRSTRLDGQLMLVHGRRRWPWRWPAAWTGCWACRSPGRLAWPS
jgi:hypothetical protein